MRKLCFSFAFFIVLSLSVFADFVDKQAVEIIQPWGDTIQVYITGDEFYNYYHDINGYTIVQDAQNVYRYALESNGKLVASAYVVGKDNPLLLKLKPYATVSVEEYERLKYEFLGYDPNTYKSLSLVDETAVFQTGDFNNVVIIIRFTDSPEFVGEESLYDLFNNPSTKSMNAYYTKISYGKLNMQCHFLPVDSTGNVIAFNAPQNYSYYNESGAKKRELFAAAIAYANEHAGGLSANIDKDNNGKVDNVSFILNHKRETAWGTPLWPHKSYYGGATLLGKTVGTYYLAYTADSYRTHCHEMFHVLSAPDLYHYTGNGISPAGAWDIMQGGGGHMTAYMKQRFGKWIDNIEPLDESGVYYMKSVGKSDVGSAYYLTPDKNKNELFYMEYRNKKDDVFEAALPGSGIIFYRIDPALKSNAQGPPDMLYIFRPNGSALVNGSLSKAHFSAQQGRRIFDPGSNPNPFYSDGSTAEFRVHSIGNAEGDSIAFTLDFEHIDNFRVTDNSYQYISLEWDKQDSVIMVCSKNPIYGAPIKGEKYYAGDVISDGSQVIYVGSDTGFIHENLASSSLYYYKIWIIDAAYNSYIGSAKTSAFTKYQDVVDQYPFYTGFEQDSVNALPTYWQGFSNEQYGLWNVNDDKPLKGLQSAKFGMYINDQLYKNTFDSHLRTMAFRMKAGKTYHISYAFKPMYNENTKIQISKHADGSALTKLYSSNFSGLSWQTHDVDFVPDADTLYYIYFGAYGYQAYGGFIDEVSVTTESPVLMPDQLKSTFINDTTVHLSWDERGTSISWDLKYGPKGFDPEIGGKHIENIKVKEQIIGRLKLASAYDWYVRAFDTETGLNSYWAGPGHYTTLHPQTESIERLYETFEDVEVPGLPTYWRQFVFAGEAIWGTIEVDDMVNAKAIVNNQNADTWMVTKPLNIENIARPAVSFMQNSFGYERENQQLMISDDYDGLSDPRLFTWHVLEDSTYDYGWMYHAPIDLSAYKTARSLYLGWKLNTYAGGVNLWEIDNISLSDLYNITFEVKDAQTKEAIPGVQVKDMYGNAITISDESGVAMVPVTYQEMGFTVCHEEYENVVIDKKALDGDEHILVDMKSRIKVALEVLVKSDQSPLEGAAVKYGDVLQYTDDLGELTYFTDSGAVFSCTVQLDGYNTALVNQKVTESTRIKVELTKPKLLLPVSNYSVSLDWRDTVLCVLMQNNGNGPVSWSLTNNFEESENMYNGLVDEPYLWSVASSKAHPERSYLVKKHLHKTDSVLAYIAIATPFKSIEFDNHQRLFGVTQYGRYVCHIDKETGGVDTLVNGIDYDVRFDEVVINRFNGNIFALGGDPYNTDDKKVFAIEGDSIKQILDMDKRDLGLFFTGYKDYVLGSIATQGTWKINAEGVLSGRFPRKYNLGSLVSTWNATDNRVILYSDQVGANGTVYTKNFGALTLSNGSYEALGTEVDSLSTVAIGASSRMNDWFLADASEGRIEANHTDTIKIHILNGIPQSDEFSISGEISTDPDIGTYQFNVGVSLEGHTRTDKIHGEYVAIYPNPSKGMFTLKGVQGHITVYNVMGHEILRKECTNNDVLNLSNQSKGLYIIKNRDTGVVFKIRKE